MKMIENSTNLMAREIGNRSFPVWLLGDSNPPQWEAMLNAPLDPRHPIRHNIWTSVSDVVQDTVYRVARLRLDTSQLYIRNAVKDPISKGWDASTQIEIEEYCYLLQAYRPILVFCFGAFAYEFGRRALRETPSFYTRHWSSKTLGETFNEKIKSFNITQINLIPLLHRVISGGKFLESHKYFCNDHTGNYFEVTGVGIAELMLKYRSDLDIWIK